MVNEWIINENEGDERKYELLIMSPTEIERLDRPEGQEQFENKLDPGDIDPVSYTHLTLPTSDLV